MGCLDDSTIYEFAMGALGRDELATADAHIDDCEDCRMVVVGLVRTGGSGVASGIEKTQLDPSLELEAGDGTAALRRGYVLGEKYVVLDVLGAGAMGIVYSAWDSVLERKVAIKTLRADASFKDRKERFVREAQAMAKIAHPNVVAVHDVGEVGARAYIAMEFVQGSTLRDWGRQTSRSWTELRDMCVQAGHGLAAAHAAGLVHRDFKPENVIVGSDNRARVTDFGLVALGGSPAEPVGSSPELMELTTTGAVLGTPAYMAPEQFRAEAVDARTDQYSFCATTWELLFGSRPIEAKTFDEQLRRVLGGDLPAPPKGAPAWLSQALLRGLAVKPEQRHASMDVLLEAMCRDRKSSPGRRVGVGVAVAGLGIAAALIAGRGQPEAASPCAGADDAIAAVWNPARSEGLQQRFSQIDGSAVAGLGSAMEAWAQGWSSAHTETCQATHVRGEQSAELLDARMLCLRLRADETDALLAEIEDGDLATLTAGIAGIAELPAVESCSAIERVADVLVAPPAAEKLRAPLTKARALVATGQYQEAQVALRALVEEGKILGYAPFLAEAQLLLARAVWKAGRADLASGIATEALLAALEGGADSEAAESWIALMGMAGEQGDYDLATERSRYASAAVARLGLPSTLQSRLQLGLGVLLYNRGRYEAALPALTRAMELRIARLGSQHTLVANSHTSLGNVHRALGNLEHAARHHKTALAIDRSIWGPEHPNLGRHEHNLAGVFRLQGNATEARKHYLLALQIKRASLGDDHVDAALTENSLGLLALAEQDYVEAEARFSSAETKLTAAGHADRAVSAHNRGLVATAQGDAKRALQHYARALQSYSKEQHELRETLERQIAEAESTIASGRTQVRPKKKMRKDGIAIPESGVYAPTQTWE